MVAWLLFRTSGEAEGQTITAFRGSHRSTSCAVRDLDKIICGFPGIDASQCKELGCCFAPVHNPSWPQCFYSKEKEAESCSLVPGQVSDCGKYDILQDPLGLTCKSQGCCFLASGPQGSAICFKKRYPQPVALATPSCKVPEANRRACSSQEATPSQCLDRGCCYGKVQTRGSAASCYFAELSAAPAGAAAAAAGAESVRSPAWAEEVPAAGLGTARWVTNGATKLTVAASKKPTAGPTSTSVARAEGSPAELFPTAFVDKTNDTLGGRQGEGPWISTMKNKRTTAVSTSSAQVTTTVQATEFMTLMVAGTTLETSGTRAVASKSSTKTNTPPMETTASITTDAVKQDARNVRTTQEATADESGTSMHTRGDEWRSNIAAQRNETAYVVTVAAESSTAAATVPSAKTVLATAASTTATADMGSSVAMTITTATGTTNDTNVMNTTTMVTATFTSTTMTPTATAAFMHSQTTIHASATTAASRTTITKTTTTATTRTITATRITTSTQIETASKASSTDAVARTTTTTTSPHALVPSSDAASIPGILHDDAFGHGHSSERQLFRSLVVFASLTALAVIMTVAAILMMCFFRSTPEEEEDEETCNHSDDLQDSKLYFYNAVPQSAESSKCTRLHPRSEEYKELQRQFIMRWDTTLWTGGEDEGMSIPPPAIHEIWEIHAETHEQFYMAKQLELDQQPGHKHGYNPGNEKSRYHGARLKCSFRGVPCQDEKCKVCRIIEDGNFSSSKHHQEIRFTLASHAAKGCGLAPDKEPPPRNLSHFLHREAGNAIFVASVLLGTPHVVTSKQSGPLPPGTHSRVADKRCGVDELVIFDTAQAIPRALITFR